MFVMYDSVDTAEIPSHANAVGAYAGGNFPTYMSVKRGWPHAHVLSIAVNSGEHRCADGTAIECLDIEPGDATPSLAPAWFHAQRSIGVKRPCFYGSLSWVPQIEAALHGAGIARHEYRVWSAHYTFHAHICGPQCGLSTSADATQWTDRALGRNLDESLCNGAFFASTPTPPNTRALTRAERRDVALYDRLAQHPKAHPVGLRKVRQRLVSHRKAIWAAANAEIHHGRSKASAWRFRNRGARYAILWSRTRGLR